VRRQKEEGERERERRGEHEGQHAERQSNAVKIMAA